MDKKLIIIIYVVNTVHLKPKKSTVVKLTKQERKRRARVRTWMRRI